MVMIDTLQILRALNHETFISSAHIAEQLEMSPARVNQALQYAENYGAPLRRREGEGYRLHQAIDWLDAEKVSVLLGGLSTHYKLTVAPYIASTNKILLADNAAGHGHVLAAEWQSQGKGRLSRAWQGFLGGSLMFSVKRVFPQSIAALSGLSLAVGVALMRGLNHVGVQGAALKWPNDLLCATGKLGGVLIETKGSASGPCEIVVGIGVNCRLADQSKTNQAYADLYSLGFKEDRNALWASLLTSLYEVLNQFEKEGFTPFLSEWEAAHLWQNQMVNIFHEQQVKATGKAVGVTLDGALRLMANGQEQHFFSGDISLRRHV